MKPSSEINCGAKTIFAPMLFGMAFVLSVRFFQVGNAIKSQYKMQRFESLYTCGIIYASVVVERKLALFNLQFKMKVEENCKA
jgi:hypothetical protein